MEKEKIVCPNCQAEVSLEASIFQKYLEQIKENDALKQTILELKETLSGQVHRNRSLEAHLVEVGNELKQKELELEAIRAELVRKELEGKIHLPETLELTVNIKPSRAENKG